MSEEKRAHPRLSREEEADQALRHTRVSPTTAAALIAAFLLIIAAVPVVQASVEARRTRKLPPSLTDAAALLPSRVALRDLLRIRGPRSIVKYGLLGWLPPEPKIREYEANLDKRSVLTEWFLPPTQAVLTGVFHTGNMEIVVGRDGWLYYHGDLGYLLQPPFAETPNPPIAEQIIDMDRQFRARGIRLIVVPMPVKPTLFPEHLAPGRYDARSAPIQNPSFAPFKARLADAGVTVFDPLPIFAAAKRSGRIDDLWLHTDTHWSPRGMALFADELARFVEAQKALPARPRVPYRHVPLPARIGGDGIRLLKLSDRQRLYPKESVTLDQIQTPDGHFWEPSPSADILLIGDSFTGIYSDSVVGRYSGLAEHLSAELGRPVDRLLAIGQNPIDLGTRFHQLQSENPDWMKNKRVVVWEFTVRDIIYRPWGPVDLKLPAAKRAPREP